VLAAVAHAHSHLVIHRDIKPTNILVSADGHVKLLDFGIAKLLEDGVQGSPVTAEGQRALTPEYAAPEQLQGAPVTTAADVYAPGVLLYQLLVGHHPTAPDTASSADVMRATLDTDPRRMSIALTLLVPAGSEAPTQAATARSTSLPRLRRMLHGDLENIVARTLRKNPLERYQTVAALTEDLRRCRADEPVSARPDSLAYRCAKSKPRG
jgi:eukaryotic-like serine/threonine-protein kinase